MALKIVEGTELRVGNHVTLEGEHYLIKNIDISKTGKHGHAKCRIEATHIVSSKKKVLIVPGHEKFEIPMINKRKGQILSLSENSANLMDEESFENLELPIPDELKGQLSEGCTIEYWDMEGQKLIKRTL